MRPAKQKKDNNFVVWIATKELFKRQNYVLFHISVCRTLKQVRLAKPAKTQKRVNFLAFSTPLFIYSKSDTTIIWCCGSLRTFVLICYLEFTFHVKHCESNIKFVTIIPVRIKKRKVKKGGNIPLLPHRISFRYFSFSSFQNSPFTWYSGSCSFPALNSTFLINRQEKCSKNFAYSK